MITKSKGVPHTSQQHPKFLIKYNLSSYHFFFSVVPYLTHSKVRNSQCEQLDSLWLAPAPSLAPSLTTLLPHLCSSHTRPQTLLWIHLGCSHFKVLADSFSVPKKFSPWLQSFSTFFKESFQILSIDKIYLCSTFKKSNATSHLLIF